MPPFFVVFLVVFLADFFFAMASSTSFHQSMYVLQKFASTFFYAPRGKFVGARCARLRAIGRADDGKCHYAESAEERGDRGEGRTKRSLHLPSPRSSRSPRMAFDLVSARRARDNARHT